MGFPIWPYTNFHDLNADWILCQIKDLKTELETLSNSVSGNSDKITQLQTDLDNLENTVNDIIKYKSSDVFRVQREKTMGFRIFCIFCALTQWTMSCKV